MWRGEAEAVAQRRRQQSGPGGGADQGERRQLQRDGGGAGALADDRRRPGSPPSPCRASPRRAGTSGGSRRGRAPRPPGGRRGSRRGRRRAGWRGREVMRIGAPISAAMIIERVVLPRPGAPESRTWSAVAPRCAGGLQHQVELLAHPLLADELVQVLGPQRGLDGLVLAVGVGADQPLGGAPSRRSCRPSSSVCLAVSWAVGRSCGRGAAVGAAGAGAGRAVSGRGSGSAGRPRSSCAHLRRAAVGGRLGLRGDGGDRLVGLAGGVAEADQRGVQLVAPGRRRRPLPTAGRAGAAAARRAGPSAPAAASGRPSCRCRARR